MVIYLCANLRSLYMRKTLTSYFYYVYGLSLESDQPLATLLKLPSSPQQIDLHITFLQKPPSDFGELEWFPHPLFNLRQQDQAGKLDYVQVLTTVDQKYLQLHYIDDVRFFLDVAAKQLWVVSPPQFSHAYVVSYVTNAVLRVSAFA